PKRKLPALYTQEPTQDGERTVTLRRVGENPIVQAMYRVPAGSHPEYPAIDILSRLLGEAPTGRLHRALVQKGLASYVWGGERGEIPATPDLKSALAGYRGGESVKLGEAFEASPAFIESRIVRRNLANGMSAAFLPKKTRGGRVVVGLALHLGDEKSLNNRE